MATTELCERGSKKLSDKEREFVDQYLIDLDGTKAAIRAGYSSKSAQSAACQLLQRPRIKSEIGKLLREQHEDHVLTRTDILEQLAYIVTRDIREFVDDRGIALPIHCLGDRAAQSVDAFEQEVHETLNPATGEVIARDVKNKLKLVGKAGAIEMAMKYRGLFAAEEHHHKVEGEVNHSFDFNKLLQPPKADNPVDKAFAELEAKGTIEQSPKEPPLVLEVKKNKDGTKTVKPRINKSGEQAKDVRDGKDSSATAKSRSKRNGKDPKDNEGS